MGCRTSARLLGPFQVGPVSGRALRIASRIRCWILQHYTGSFGKPVVI